MDFSAIFALVCGTVSLCAFVIYIRSSIEEVRHFRRCSVIVSAQVLSWRIEEDSDNPTMCIPTIRYSWKDQVYETEWLDGAVTRYQKEHDFTGDTMRIYLNPEAPTAIAPEDKLRRMIGRIGVGMVVCVFSLIFVVASVGYLIHIIA